MADPIHGPPLANSLSIAPNEVHIWQIDVRVDEPRLKAYRRLLTPDEIARADRYLYDRHRSAFTAARGALRTILAGYTASDPKRVRFEYEHAGKPHLAEGDLKFNLSHSGDLALCAVALSQEVGVDIERIRPLDDAAAIARRYFAAAEVAAWEAIPQDERLAAFYRCWTRKEAYLKALGDGLRAPLDAFVVTLAPHESPRFLSYSPHDLMAKWVISDIPVNDGYIAALVSPPGPAAVYRSFEHVA